MADDQQVDQGGGGGGALSQLRERAGGDPVIGQLQTLMQGLNDPEKRSKDEWLSFAGGMAAPNPTGNFSLAYGNGLKAQSDQRLEKDKLMSEYMRMVLPQLVQNQSLQLSAVKNQQELAQKVNPVADSMLGGLMAGQNAPGWRPPTGLDAAQVIHNVANQYSMPRSWVNDRLTELRANQDNIPQFITQKVAGAAGAEKQLPSLKDNAAGVTVQQSGVAGTVQPVATPGTGGSGGLGVNPSKVGVKGAEESMGDVKQYDESLRNTLHAYRDMNQRMNAIAGNLDQITPGRYMGVAGGVAAAVKDVSKYFPNASQDVVQGFVNTMLGAKGDGKGTDPLAAQQFAKALVAQEGIAQTRALTTGESANAQRLGQREIMLVTSKIPTDLTDPGAYQKFADFMRAQQGNAQNKYDAWKEHVVQTHPEKLSVTGFDAPWERNNTIQQLRGEYGAMTPPPGASNVNPVKPTQGMVEPARRPAPAAPVARAEAAPPADLAKYEPGALIGPTGKVLVRDPTDARGYRLAKLKGQ